MVPMPAFQRSTMYAKIMKNLSLDHLKSHHYTHLATPKATYATMLSILLQTKRPSSPASMYLQRKDERKVARERKRWRRGLLYHVTLLINALRIALFSLPELENSSKVMHGTCTESSFMLSQSFLMILGSIVVTNTQETISRYL